MCDQLTEFYLRFMDNIEDNHEEQNVPVTERYFSANRERPTISHSSFTTAPSQFEFDEEHKLQLIQYLLEIEPQYEPQLKKTKHKSVSDERIVNELFSKCYVKFSGIISSIYIFDEIAAFFNFDSRDFYNSLDVHTKNMLRQSLAKKINLDTFNRKEIKKMIEKNNGYYQKSFIPKSKK